MALQSDGRPLKNRLSHIKLDHSGMFVELSASERNKREQKKQKTCRSKKKPTDAIADGTDVLFTKGSKKMSGKVVSSTSRKKGNMFQNNRKKGRQYKIRCH